MAAGLASGLIGPASAQGGGAISNGGGCSVVSSSWSLQADGVNGRIDVQAEVLTGVPKQVWRWRLSDNGRLAAKGTATTMGDNGGSNVKIERFLEDAAGPDVLRFRARVPASGETCEGGLTF